MKDSAASAQFPALSRLLYLAAATGVCAAALSAQQLPAGKGRDTFEKVCTTCHDAETTVNLRNTREGWREVVKTMIGNGAEGTEAQFSEIVEYLTVHFGKTESSASPAAKAAPAHSSSVAAPARPAALHAVPWEKNRLRTGRAVYRENCVVCHDVEVEKSAKLGPNFYHLFQREKMPNSSAKPDRQYIAGKVRVGGPLMPAFAKKLSSGEIEALLDYMQSK